MIIFSRYTGEVFGKQISKLLKNIFEEHGIRTSIHEDPEQIKNIKDQDIFCIVDPNKFKRHCSHLKSLGNRVFFWNLEPILDVMPATIKATCFYEYKKVIKEISEKQLVDFAFFYIKSQEILFAECFKHSAFLPIGYHEVFCSAIKENKKKELLFIGDTSDYRNVMISKIVATGQKIIKCGNSNIFKSNRESQDYISGFIGCIAIRPFYENVKAISWHRLCICAANDVLFFSDVGLEEYGLVDGEDYIYYNINNIKYKFNEMAANSDLVKNITSCLRNKIIKNFNMRRFVEKEIIPLL